MGEVPRLFRGIAPTKPLVIAVNELPSIIDDIQAVVRLMRCGQLVRRTQNRPQRECTSQGKPLMGTGTQQLPLKPGMRCQVRACIPRQARLGKVRDIGPLFPGLLHQLRDMLEVARNIRTGWELAGCDRELHMGHSQKRWLMSDTKVPEA